MGGRGRTENAGVQAQGPRRCRQAERPPTPRALTSWHRGSAGRFAGGDTGHDVLSAPVSVSPTQPASGLRMPQKWTVPREQGTSTTSSLPRLRPGLPMSRLHSSASGRDASMRDSSVFSPSLESPSPRRPDLRACLKLLACGNFSYSKTSGPPDTTRKEEETACVNAVSLPPPAPPILSGPVGFCVSRGKDGAEGCSRVLWVLGALPSPSRGPFSAVRPRCTRNLEIGSRCKSQAEHPSGPG